MYNTHTYYLTIVIALSGVVDIFGEFKNSSTDALCVEEHVLTVEYRKLVGMYLKVSTKITFTYR